jgi:hypothetical protein
MAYRALQGEKQYGRLQGPCKKVPRAVLCSSAIVWPWLIPLSTYKGIRMAGTAFRLEKNYWGRTRIGGRRPLQGEGAGGGCAPSCM